MKFNITALIFFTLIIFFSCGKNKDFQVPNLSCSMPVEDIQYLKSSILGEWKSIENGGENYLVEMGYKSDFIFLDSLSATKIIYFDGTDEQYKYYNYSIEPKSDGTPEEFIINLEYLTPSIENTIKFCDDEFIIYNENQNYWERYERM
jgi:hypothetical protein